MKIFLAAFLALVFVGTAAAALNTSTCLPPEGEGLSLLYYGTQLATRQGEQWEAKRSRYGLVPVTAGEVELITDETTCKKAASALAVQLGESRKTDRQVWVVRIGTRYMVTDTTVTAGEFEVSMFFDKAWKFLASLAG